MKCSGTPEFHLCNDQPSHSRPGILTKDHSGNKISGGKKKMFGKDKEMLISGNGVGGCSTWENKRKKKKIQLISPSVALLEWFWRSLEGKQDHLHIPCAEETSTEQQT